MQRIIFATLIGMAAIPAAQAAPDCTAKPAPLAVTARPTALAPVAAEFTPTVTQLGAPSGVLARSFNDAQAVDRVLQRLRIEGCQNVAKALPAAGAAVSSTDAAAYKPKTQFDNTPWRFDMNQNGKRMTAEEFDAWMKSRGVRVAKGNGAAAAAPVAAPAVAPAAAPAKKD